MQNHLIREVARSNEVQNEVKRIVREEAGDLFDRRLMRTAEWADLKAQLQVEASSGVFKIRAATDTKVAEILDQGGLAPIQAAVEANTRDQTRRLFDQADQRNAARIKDLETQVETLKSNTHGAIFLGGLAILGFGIRSLL